MPLVAAYRGEDWSLASARSTLAGGIAVAAPVRGHQVLAALGDTGGVAVAVADPDIARMQQLLAEREGVFAEPTSAAAFAGLEALIGQGVIAEDDVTLVPVTGFGLKDQA
jgi:threonine synthase